MQDYFFIYSFIYAFYSLHKHVNDTKSTYQYLIEGLYFTICDMSPLRSTGSGKYNKILNGKTKDKHPRIKVTTANICS